MALTRGRSPRNILLDFLDRDSREIWGTFRDFSNFQHRRLLSAGLNTACFLCREYCVLPPIFLTLDPIARNLLQTRADYLTKRIVRLPLKEGSLDTWIEKGSTKLAGVEVST
jgi:hypothetical protein